MALEKIVLIFALFGSAKVALDVIISAVKAASATNEQPTPSDEKSLNDAIGLLESLSLANEQLRDSNAKLLKRIDELEVNVSVLQAKPAVKRSRSAKIGTEKSAVAPGFTSNNRSLHSGQDIAMQSHDSTPYYMDSDRFEVIV